MYIIKILNLLIVLYVFSRQWLSFKQEANPAHVGTHFPRTKPKAPILKWKINP